MKCHAFCSRQAYRPMIIYFLNALLQREFESNYGTQFAMLSRNWLGKYSQLCSESLEREVLKSCNVYQIWKHRNAVLHMDSISSEEQIVAAIRKQVMRTKRFAVLYRVCWLACPACFNRILLDYCHVMETAGGIED